METVKLVMGLTFLVVFTAYLLKKALFSSEIRKCAPSLPSGRYRLFYSDQKPGREQKEDGVIYSKLLYAPKYKLQGKPDYVFIKGKRLLPVELKSGKIGDNNFPHEGDLLQLAAYFLILEDIYGVRPSSGRLIYKDHMFKIKNTSKIRRQVLSTAKAMQDMLITGEDEPNASFVTCKHCICKGTVCEYCDE